MTAAVVLQDIFTVMMSILALSNRKTVRVPQHGCFQNLLFEGIISLSIYIEKEVYNRNRKSNLVVVKLCYLQKSYHSPDQHGTQKQRHLESDVRTSFLPSIPAWLQWAHDF